MFSLLSSFNSKAPAGQSFETQKPQPMRETKHCGFTIDIKKLKCILTYLLAARFQHEFETFKGLFRSFHCGPQSHAKRFFLNSTLRRLQATSLSAGPRSFQVTITNGNPGNKPIATVQKTELFLQKPSEVQRNSLNITDLLGEIMPHRDSF